NLEILHEMEYVIPDADRQKVLEEVYLFQDVPKLDDTLFDLHEEKTFAVRDFRVIRWHGANLLASPYFPRSGGMLVDWVAPGETDKAVRAFARKEDGDGE
ncbi:MAG: hypothetical protein WC922_10195, partial [Synergistaceae bacterium]